MSRANHFILCRIPPIRMHSTTAVARATLLVAAALLGPPAAEAQLATHPSISPALPNAQFSTNLGHWGESVVEHLFRARGFEVIDAKLGPQGLDRIAYKLDSSGNPIDVRCCEIKTRTAAGDLGKPGMTRLGPQLGSEKLAFDLEQAARRSADPKTRSIAARIAAMHRKDPNLIRAERHVLTLEDGRYRIYQGPTNGRVVGRPVANGSLDEILERLSRSTDARTAQNARSAREFLRALRQPPQSLPKVKFPKTWPVRDKLKLPPMARRGLLVPPDWGDPTSAFPRREQVVVRRSTDARTAQNAGSAREYLRALRQPPQSPPKVKFPKTWPVRDKLKLPPMARRGLVVPPDWGDPTSAFPRREQVVVRPTPASGLGSAALGGALTAATIAAFAAYEWHQGEISDARLHEELLRAGGVGAAVTLASGAVMILSPAAPGIVLVAVGAATVSAADAAFDWAMERENAHLVLEHARIVYGEDAPTAGADPLAPRPPLPNPLGDLLRERREQTRDPMHSDGRPQHGGDGDPA